MFRLTTRVWSSKLRERCMKALIFVYNNIIEKVAHTHAQNAPLEWFSSRPGLEVVSRPLSKICWLYQRNTSP